MQLPNEIRVGTAGWSYSDWVGKIYPRLKPRGFHEAAYLARFFDTLEINTSFYREVRPEHARVWVSRVAHNQRFLFTAKLHRSFTHDLNPSDADEAAFRALVDVLAEGGRLGAVLAQFPWSFKHTAENRAYVAALLERFREYPIVVEMRHSEWMSPPFLALLRERNAGFANIDQPTLSHGMEPSAVVTGSIAYFRLHGRNYKSWFKQGESEARHERYNYLYTADELRPWSGRIKAASANAGQTFVISNNHFEGKAAANSLEIASMLLGEKVSGPEPLVENYPELREFVTTEVPTQQGLFAQ